MNTVILVFLVLFLSIAFINSYHKAKWNSILSEREKLYGKLTQIVAMRPRENSICLYEESETLLIGNRLLSFEDVLSCDIKSELIKGREYYVTKPDRGDLAIKELLYGQGKAHNVKQITTLEKSPDFTQYQVIVSLSTPYPIIINAGRDGILANEICNTINLAAKNKHGCIRRTLPTNEP